MPPAQALRNSGNSPCFTAEKSPRLGILSNDLSGGNLKDPDAIYRQVRGLPNVFYRRTRTPVDISAALREFAEEEIDILMINGGDGTIQASFSILFNDQPFVENPPLALLAAGTTSMTAGDVGLRGRHTRALERFLKWMINPETPASIQRRSILRVQGPGVRRDEYGMFFGTAAIYQAIAYCRDRIHTLGVKGEIGPGIALVRFMVALARGDRRYVTPLPLQISLDGIERESQDCLLVMSSTLKRLFLGIQPFWGRGPGRLRFTAITANPERVVRSLPSILRGRQAPWMTESNGYTSRNVSGLTLNLDSGFTLDGELFMPDASKGPTIVSDGGQLDFMGI